MSSLVLNMVGGSGGGISGFGYISIMASAGATVTATDGVQIITTPSTETLRFVAVPYAATWTVSCTDLNGTRTKSVVISSQNQCEFISFEKLYLYQQGDTLSTLWNADQLDASAPASSANGLLLEVPSTRSTAIRRSYVYTNKFINPQGYSTLKATAVDISGSNLRTTNLGIFLTTDITPAFDQYGAVVDNVLGSSYIQKTANNAWAEDPHTFTIDISNISDPFTVVGVVGMNPYGTQVNRFATMTVTQIYLE